MPRGGQNRIDETGKRFGRLTALFLDYKIDRVTYYRFRCDCGVEFSANISNVRQGRTQSCGCLRNDRMREYNQTRVNNKRKGNL